MGLINDLATVVDELLAELLRKLVSLATLRVALVDVVLHVRDQVGIRTVHDGNAASGNLTIDGSQAAEDDVVEHEQSVLSNPVPRRVEMTGLQSVEDRLDAVNVRIAVLAGNGVQARLEPLGVGLLCVILDLTSADVAL